MSRPWVMIWWMLLVASAAQAQDERTIMAVPDAPVAEHADEQAAVSPAAPPMAAQAAAAPAPPAAQQPLAPRPTHPRYSRIGLQLDFGVPDLLGLNFVFRTPPFLRLHAGPVFNLISFGLRAGVSIVPFQYWITPALVLEGGRYFEGDANRVAGMFGAQSPQLAVLERIGYDFANAHLSIELGSQGFKFFVRAGITHVQTQVHNLQQLAASASSTLEIDSARIRFTAPSAKLGFIFYL